MTLYKKFSDNSSVYMQELQKIAMSLAEPTPVAEIVKKASLQRKSLAPTNNLTTDLFALADSLLSKGYVKESENLLQKLVAYKKAAVEFSSILDQAHPDGDLEVGTDVVETLDSAHLKMIEVVNKVPTGKQASINSFIEKIAGLLKEGQEINLDEEFSGARAKRENSIKILNEKLASDFPAIGNTLKTGLSDIRPWQISPAAVLQSPSIASAYSELAGFALSNINEFLQLNVMLGEEPLNVKTPSAKFIGTLPVESAKNLVTAINPNLVSLFETDASSVTENSYQSKLNEIIVGVQKAWLAKYNSIFGKINEISADLENKKTKCLTEYYSVVNSFSGEVPQLTSDSRSSAALATELNKQISVLALYVEGGTKAKEFTNLYSKLWPNWTPLLFGAAKSASEMIKNLVSTFNKAAISPGDALVTDTSAVLANVLGAGNLFYKAKQGLDTKDPKFVMFETNQNVAQQLANIIKSSEGQPYAALFAQLQDFPPFFTNATSQESLLSASSALLNAAAQATGLEAAPYTKAHADFKLIKNAAGFVGLNGPSAAKPSSSTPASTGSKASYPAIPKDLIKSFQTIIGAHPDGIIGPETIKAFNLFLTKNPELKLDKNFSESSIKKNIEAIKSVNEPKIEKSGQELDKLDSTAVQPSGMNEGVISTKTEQGNPVYEGNVSSLQSLYNYLTALGMQPVRVESTDPGQLGVQGFTVSMWKSIIDWFLKRAYFLNSGAKTPEEKAKTVLYHSRVKALGDNLKGWAVTHKADLNSDTLLPENQLATATYKTQATKATLPNVAQPEEDLSNPYNVSRQNRNPGNYEGQDINSQLQDLPAPINLTNGNIDLSLPWYRSMGRQPARLLNLDYMSYASGTEIADILFPNVSDAYTTYYNYINILRKKIADAIQRWSYVNPPPTAEELKSMFEWRGRWQEVFSRHLSDLTPKLKRGL